MPGAAVELVAYNCAPERQEESCSAALLLGSPPETPAWLRRAAAASASMQVQSRAGRAPLSVWWADRTPTATDRLSDRPSNARNGAADASEESMAELTPEQGAARAGLQTPVAWDVDESVRTLAWGAETPAWLLEAEARIEEEAAEAHATAALLHGGDAAAAEARAALAPLHQG
eukprot:3105176-Prymnesium_polylepis.1